MSVNAGLSGTTAGERPEEAQQCEKLVVVEAFLQQEGEALQERGRQSLLNDGRHEAGACGLPERRRGEPAAPPRAPTCNRARRHRNDLGQALEASRGCAGSHDCDQYDGRGHVDAAAEKAQRRRRRSAPTSVSAAAEREALVVLGAELYRATARLALVVRHIELVAAVDASLTMLLVGKITIAGEQEVMK